MARAITPTTEKLAPGSLGWMEMVHQALLHGQFPRAVEMLEVAIRKLRNSDGEKGDKIKKASECPDCFGSGFKPMGPERNAPHVKCDHKGTQPILKAATPEIDIPF